MTDEQANDLATAFHDIKAIAGTLHNIGTGVVPVVPEALTDLASDLDDHANGIARVAAGQPYDNAAEAKASGGSR